MSCNIGLLAANDVGVEVIKFLDEEGEKLACVIVDSRDETGCSDEIRRIATNVTETVLESDALDDDATLDVLGSLDIDLLVLAWWPYVIRKPLIDLPRIGALNFHPSYLPHNRGKHYNFWAIVEDAPFGVSLHFVDESIDSGDIAFQSRIATSWEDTGETLYRKAQAAILQLFKSEFPAIRQGNIPRRPQDLEQGSFHMSKELEPASEISLDETYTARQLLNLLRARTFPPHPACRFTDGGETYEVRVQITNVSDARGET